MINDYNPNLNKSMIFLRNTEKKTINVMVHAHFAYFYILIICYPQKLE